MENVSAMSGMEVTRTSHFECVRKACKVAHLRPRLLSVAGAVAYSATSRATLYKEMKAGNLRFIKLNGATRIEVVDLDSWIDTKAAQAHSATS